jgi:hypothetical protein
MVTLPRVGRGAVGLVAAALALLACGIPHDDGPTPLGLEGYFLVDERTLEVEAVGACEYEDLTFNVEETDTEVRIETIGRDGGHCPGDDVGALSVGTVVLDAPLGARNVFDATCTQGCHPLSRDPELATIDS